MIDERVVTENNDEFLSWIGLQVDNSEHEGNMNWKAPEDETSSNTYTMTFEGVGDFEYKLTFKSTFEYFADPDPTDSSADSDGDGLTDAKEYEMSDNPDSYSVDGRAVPTRKDIFVEVDWMEGHEMSFKAQWKVGTRFLNNPTGEEIWLHLDTPIASSPHTLMGGGEEIEHKDTLSESEFKDDLYDSDYNGDNGFTQSRKGRFHYGVFADEIWTGRSGKCPPDLGDGFVIADGHSLVDDVTAQAGTFMHELGHSVGLHEGDESEGSGYFPGIDEEYDQDYESCMNYEYQTTLVDYSDGNNGSNDHNDWEDVLTEMDDEV